MGEVKKRGTGAKKGSKPVPGESRSPPGRHGARYPWADWFKQAAQQSLRLTRGVDFNDALLIHGLASTIRQASRRAGLRVSIFIADNNTLTFKVVGAKTSKKTR